MSIDQTDVVDIVGVDEKTGEVILTITDHYSWDDRDDDHLYLLQEKINTYLAFLESGEVYEAYPNAKGKLVIIKVVGKFALNRKVEEFLNSVAAIVDGAGFKLQFQPACRAE